MAIDWEKTATVFGLPIGILSLILGYLSVSEKFRSLFSKGGQPRKNRFQTLDGQIFIAKYRQREMVDYAFMQLTTRGRSKITGDLYVNFQSTDKSYPTDHVTSRDTVDRMRALAALKIKGNFLSNNFLALIYRNSDPNFDHTGVISLKYESNFSLEGKYISYHDSIPERKVPCGRVHWFRATSLDAAQRFATRQLDIYDAMKDRHHITQQEVDESWQ